MSVRLEGAGRSERSRPREVAKHPSDGLAPKSCSPHVPSSDSPLPPFP